MNAIPSLYFPFLCTVTRSLEGGGGGGGADGMMAAAAAGEVALFRKG